MSTVINRRDLSFLLYELLDVEGLCQNRKYADHDRASFDAVLDLAQQIAEDKFAPIAARLDENEPEFDGEKVHILPEVKEAHNAYIDAGFMNAAGSYEEGGMQLPLTIMQSVRAIFASANIPAMGYLSLTNSAANMLNVWGSEELKQTFLPPMRDGRFYGTMCLSEPHAGSNLADIRTRAEPQEDGSYRIYGTKMWISGGEHDLSENIVHMVLAKIPGGPPGVKGISLFVVPKYRVNEDGSVGERNGVNLVGLNHKMGYRGTTNTLLNFGEKEPCVGYLMGGEHEGLKCMFHMMNEARIGVGMGAVMLGYAGYLHSLEYAKERPQGRLPGDKNPDSPQVNIIQHADVKRMLLKQKAYVEGGLALTLYCGKLVDDIRTEQDADKKADMELFMDLLTPIVKAWPSDFCLKANELAIQVLGGAGYTRDYPVERLYRDNRLNPIHEGTNGIQGMDLLGRKVRMKGGKAFTLLQNDMRKTIDLAAANGLQEYADALTNTLGELIQTTEQLLKAAADDILLATANATIYLRAFGHTVVAWLWLKQALAAQQGLENATGSEQDFYNGKLAACRYFFRYELPSVQTDLDLLNRLDDTCLNLAEASF